MSFRKRSIPLTTNIGTSQSQSATPNRPGVRPSPLDGRPTTSTGTPTLDALFSGHAGLPLGTSLLIEESGTTDFAGALLRFYAAEGVVQGHRVHVVGAREGWGRELPGLFGEAEARKSREDERSNGKSREKMKIAWRYEGLGEFGESTTARAPTPSRTPMAPPSQSQERTPPHQPFCHTFDLTKRLVPPSTSPAISYYPIPSDFSTLLHTLSTSLTTDPTSIHRLILPTLLSPLIYPASTASPTILLPFIHSLRSLLRRFLTRLTIFITFPLSLHPRSTGLTRWIELLLDGVIELNPFPHGHRLAASDSNAAKGKEDEKPQGMLKVWKVPVQSERGQGVGKAGEDMAFWVSRRRFVVKAFSLPPVEGDEEAQEAGSGGGGGGKGMEF